MLKKRIDSSQTGIVSIEVDEHGDLIFHLADGSTITVDLPIKTDCVDIKIVTQLPTENISPTTIYLLKTAMTDTDGDSIYIQYLYVNSEWKIIGRSGVPVATGNQYGLVKLDGTSLIQNTDGSIGISKSYLNDELINNISEAEIGLLF